MPRREGGLLAMVGHEFCVLGDDGSLEPFARLDLRGAPTRFNDCKVDPRGRLLAGTMVIDLSEPGQLVRLDPDGTLTPLLGDVQLSNGLDWSPDGETFYFTDTPTLGIDAFDYDLDAGTISNRRRVVTIPRGEGAPDGMCVDDEGCLWTATIFSGQIRRYSPDGELLGVIDTPAHQVSSCTFAARRAVHHDHRRGDPALPAAGPRARRGPDRRRDRQPGQRAAAVVPARRHGSARDAVRLNLRRARGARRRSGCAACRCAGS